MAEATRNIFLNTTTPDTFIEIRSDNSRIEYYGTDFRDFYFNSHYMDDFASGYSTSIDAGLLHLYVNPETDRSVNFEFYVTENGETVTYMVSYSASMSQSPASQYPNGVSLDNDRCSFMLLRTNPKLTGNIKLVVDSSDNMYLDTFPVSDILSKQQYRHALVSANSYFSNDVKNIFGSLPQTELYRVAPENYELFNVRTKYKDQFVDTYSYGVRTNLNKTYPENFALLAPLWINQTIPDFFVVFRVDGTEDPDGLDSTEKMKAFLREGKIVKAYDMRKHTPLGNYIRNAQSESGISPGCVYMSGDNYNYNSWFGISVDGGIVTQKNETSYKLGKIANQVELDNYITSGFERNRLISSNLINIEFMFDDPDAEDFSINRYFGLYLVNSEYKTIYVSKNKDNKDDAPIIYDDKYVEVNSLSKETDPAASNEIYSTDRIFNITLDTDVSSRFRRITPDSVDTNGMSSDILGVILKNEYANNPYKNILTISAEEHCQFNPDGTENSRYNTQFITIQINHPLEPGEHLRIIDYNPAMDNSSVIEAEIYEVIAGKVTDNYYDAEEYFAREMFEDITYRNMGDYLTTDKSDGKLLKYHRTVFGGYSTDDDFSSHGDMDEKDVIALQIRQIVTAFSKLSNRPYEISQYDGNTISFKSKDSINFLRFERIASKVFIEDYDRYTDEELSAYDSDITYFNDFRIPYTKLPVDKVVDFDTMVFMPADFECWNNRIGYVVDFVKSNAGKVGSTVIEDFIYTLPKNEYKDIDAKSLVCAISPADGEDEFEKDFIVINDFDIKFNRFDEKSGKMVSERYADVPNANATNVVRSYLDSDRYIITTDKKAVMQNGKINIYSMTPIHINIAGMIPVRDFDFNVLDSVTTVDGITPDTTSIYAEGYSDKEFLSKTIAKGEEFVLTNNSEYILTSGTLTWTDNDGTEHKFVSADHIPVGTYTLKNNSDMNAVITVATHSADVDYQIKPATGGTEEYISSYFNLKTAQTDIDPKELYETTGKSNISLTTPTNLKWNTIGKDMVGNPIKFGLNFDGGNSGSYYLNLDGKSFGYPIYKALGGGPGSPYVYNDLKDITYYRTEDGSTRTCTYKDRILHHGGNIDEIVGDGRKYVKMYYNISNDSLDTIICGKKISVTKNGTHKFALNEYDNYLFSFVCSTARSEHPVELIIDENHSNMLMVWYTNSNNLSYTHRNSYVVDNIYDENMMNAQDNLVFYKLNGGILSDDILDEKKLPLIYYGNTEEFGLDDGAKIFVSHIEKRSPDDIAINYNATYEYDGVTYADGYVSAGSNLVKSKDARAWGIYDFDEDGKLMGEELSKIRLNVHDGMQYMDHYDGEADVYIVNSERHSPDLDVSSLAGTIENNGIYLYVKTHSGVDAYSNAIGVSFTEPLDINKTLYSRKDAEPFYIYPWYCSPQMKDIFLFENNEEKGVVETTEMNYGMSNTRIAKVNPIGQIFVNKVSSELGFVDAADPHLTIDLVKDYDVTKSAWHAERFAKYSKNGEKTPVPGYAAQTDVASFFGSNAIKLPDIELEIGTIGSENWSVKSLKKYNQSQDNIEKYVITVNLSKILFNRISDDVRFKNNFMTTDKTKYEKGYLENLLESVFTINKKNTVRIYRRTANLKSTDGLIVSYSDDSGFDFVANMSSSVYKDSGQYYIDIEVPKTLTYQYAIKYSLNK